MNENDENQGKHSTPRSRIRGLIRYLMYTGAAKKKRKFMEDGIIMFAILSNAD